MKKFSNQEKFSGILDLVSGILYFFSCFLVFFVFSFYFVCVCVWFFVLVRGEGNFFFYFFFIYLSANGHLLQLGKLLEGYFESTWYFKTIPSKKTYYWGKRMVDYMGQVGLNFIYSTSVCFEACNDGIISFSFKILERAKLFIFTKNTARLQFNILLQIFLKCEPVTCLEPKRFFGPSW